LENSVWLLGFGIVISLAMLWLACDQRERAIRQLIQEIYRELILLLLLMNINKGDVEKTV